MYNRTLLTLKKWWFVPVILILILVVYLVLAQKTKTIEKDSYVTIILSPHISDAVVSVGGLLAQEQYQTVVANFFTDALEGEKLDTQTQETILKEDQNALKAFNTKIVNNSYPEFIRSNPESKELVQAEIAKDIQALITSYSIKNRVNSFSLKVLLALYLNYSVLFPNYFVLPKLKP